MSAREGIRTGVTRRRLSTWVVVATAAWTAESVVYAVQIQLLAVRSGQPVGFSTSLVQSLVSALLWVPFTVMALWLAFRWPVTASRRYWLIHVAGFVVLVAGRATAVVALNETLRYYPDGVPPWHELLLTSTFNNLVTYVLMTGLAHAVFYHETARATERRFAAARLSALTSQLQPHFLFNALNTIAALIPSRPEAAERMIVDLAALLRFSVDRDSAALIPLEEEIEIGQAYLKIEEHRFASRLRVTTHIDPDVRGTAVPPFLLQPLLENAVRHGLAPRTGRSTLEIHAARTGDRVHIRIADDGIGLPDMDGSLLAGPVSDRRFGLGLQNVRERLHETFGAEAHLELTNRKPAGAVAMVVVPYRSLVRAGTSR